MRVVIINGSPRMEKGYTSLITEPFIEGMKEAGAEVTLRYARKLKIKPCIGDFSCWYEKPGECIYKDDMESIYQLIAECDILIFATPVYIPLPGEMQNLINRLCPLIEPVLQDKNGRTRARFHKKVRLKKILLLATGGWWEMGNFDTIKRIFKELAADSGVEFMDPVLRPHAFRMDSNPEEKKTILKDLRKAGYQIIREGKISEDKLKSIGRPLISFEDDLRSQTDYYLKQKNKGD